MYLKDILIHNSKLRTMEDLKSNIDAVIELARDDVKRVAKSKSKFFADFDSTFSIASKMLKSTISKVHLKGVKRILSCEKIDETANWIVARLLNNMQNITQNNNYANYFKIDIKDDVDYRLICEDDDFMQIDIKNDLQKIDRDTLKIGLKKAWNEGMYDDFDVFEFEKLCKDFDFNSFDVLGYDPKEIPKFTTLAVAGGHQQLAFVF